MLVDKMGISTMAKSIDTLTHLFRGFINKCGKEPVRTARCEIVFLLSTWADVVENHSAVYSYSLILPLYLKADFNEDLVQDFDPDYMDYTVHVPPWNYKLYPKRNINDRSL